jgi:hypothetical protein
MKEITSGTYKDIVSIPQVCSQFLLVQVQGGLWTAGPHGDFLDIAIGASKHTLSPDRVPGMCQK